MGPLRVSITESERLPDDPTAFVPTRLWKLPFITTWDDSRNQNHPTDSAEDCFDSHEVPAPHDLPLSGMSHTEESEDPRAGRKPGDIHDKDLSRENTLLPGPNGRVSRSVLVDGVTVASICRNGSV